jgi:hypothetical protein
LLHDYVKFPEGFPAARIRLEWANYPAIAEPFQRKTELPPAAYNRGGLGGSGGKAGDGGPGQVMGPGDATDDRCCPSLLFDRPAELPPISQWTTATSANTPAK